MATLLLTMIEQTKAVISEVDSEELSDEEFSEKYVYGKWRFSRRIGKLEGGKKYENGKENNLGNIDRRNLNSAFESYKF